jgi:hypothetical protein
MLQEERIHEAWAEYIACATHQRVYYGELHDLVMASPFEAWSFLRQQVTEQLADETLALVAIEVVDLLRVHGGRDLWHAIATDSGRPVERIVAALNRYHAEEALFSDLLAGESPFVPAFRDEDLPIPNPYDRGCVESDSEASVAAESAQAFLTNGSGDGWEAIQWLCDVAPAKAFGLGIELLASATPEQVSWVGIGLFESLVTSNETMLSGSVLAALRGNVRLRNALSSCYLNLSEPFLHQLIMTLQESSPGA